MSAAAWFSVTNKSKTQDDTGSSSSEFLWSRGPLARRGFQWLNNQWVSWVGRLGFSLAQGPVLGCA